METGHKYKGGSWSDINESGPYVNDLAESWSRGQAFTDLALNFAGMTTDTSLLVLQHKVSAHY